MLSLAYTPTAYTHHNFQSDICKAKRTNARNPPLRRVFAFVGWTSKSPIVSFIKTAFFHQLSDF